ncbi:MAG: vWA domain-containing protein [Phycisphaerae bacterium]
MAEIRLEREENGNVQSVPPKATGKSGPIKPTAVSDCADIVLPTDVPHPQRSDHPAEKPPLLERAFPFVISLFLHLAVFVIFAFATMLMTSGTPDRETTTAVVRDIVMETPVMLQIPQRPERPEEGGSMSDRPAHRRQMDVMDDARNRNEQIIAAAASAEPIDFTGESKGSIYFGVDLSADGDGDGSDGPGDDPQADPPIGGGIRADHVVFLIDRSGSMVDKMGRVRLELLKAVAGMEAKQTFHVIFFGRGKLEENTPRPLVAATDVNKYALAEFAEGILPHGQTDPIPAVRRAFEVLSAADKNKPGKVVCLLTDGAFPDNEKLLVTVKELTAEQKVSICTFLYGEPSAEAQQVMKQIAAATGSPYKYVKLER